jgi:Ca-activated chloride channel family protein
MELLWPGWLKLLGLIPLMILFYVWVLRRRQHFALRYSNVRLVKEALGQRSGIRRHLPFALFLFSVSSLVIAVSRPVAVVSVPSGKVTIILALDVSRSMCATDIPPSRLEAAEMAALSFVQSQTNNPQFGIVAFAGFSELIQAPTDDLELVEDAIVSLITGRRTSVGNGIIKSMDTIAEIDENVARGVTDGSQIAPTPVPQGVYAPAIIVLLTDGASNTGIDPLEAAQQAADRGIRVYTIGFGTEQGGTMNCGSAYPDDGRFGFGPQFATGTGFRRGIDEPTLIQIAEITHGEYYSAESASELEEVFESLPTSTIIKYETMEISAAFVGIGVLIAAFAFALSYIWRSL